MDFQPLSDIWFCRTGIDEYNKVYCDAQSTLFNVITGGQNLIGRTTANSFQRADGFFTIRVDHNDIPYYDLLNCDTVIYTNKETTRAFYVVGNILGVDWKNPDCSFVRFKIDHFMTYQTFIDWESTYAYVEREHVKQDWSGEKPLFTNIGQFEDFGVTPDTPFYHFEKSFTPNYVMVQSPYDDSGKAVFEGEQSGNLYSSLQTRMLFPNGANEYFSKIAENKESSINNIVGVYGVPNEFSRCITNGEDYTSEEQLPTVETANLTTFEIKYNNAKCWAAPFCIIKLFSSEGSYLTFNPQWFGNTPQNYRLMIKATGSGKQFGGAAAAFDNQAGAFDWKTWNDFTVFLKELPKCPWTADGFANWWSTNAPSVIGRGIDTAVRSVGNATQAAIKGIAGVATGNPVASISAVSDAMNMYGNTMSSLADIESTIRGAQASGATIQGTGSFGQLFDVAQDAWGFKVVYYTVQNYIMRGIDQFFDRFGYRVNQLKKLGLENRPIWTFIKTAECHVAPKDRGVPYISELAINAMFNRGVTIWCREKYQAGRKIGDYSNAQENRGTGGG